ncbi:ankyrin repeat-containing domain protein [Mycena pura]|uniref:Ankyrin repeat-containing domain protein n=1 Tax=Mycena pura TaxID=153505 RepID=A0AAD6VCA2_9AGAR|nr:ankyrin repeat-containing domain protein [Mycena pura]
MYRTIGPALPRDLPSAGHKSYKGPQADTPLHLAVRNRDISCASLLLDTYPDLEALDSSGETALFIAAKDGLLDFVQLLVEHGANVNAKSIETFGIIEREGWTILQITSHHGHRDIVQFLLEHGADTELHIDGDDTTALHYAITGVHIDVARLLLDWGASPVVRAADNENALHSAASQAGPEVVELMTLLIEHGTDLHAITADGTSVLELAVISGHLERVELLVKHGANFHTPPQLHHAASRGYLDLTHFFLRNGASVEQLDHRGNTALHSALENAEDLFEIVSLLLKYGPTPNICTKRNGLTPLHFAAKYKNIKSVRLLLDHGANVTVYDKDEGTPLHSAVTSLGKSAGEIVHLLLLAGADPDIRNGDGLSVKQLARMKGDTNILNALGLQPLGFESNSLWGNGNSLSTDTEDLKKREQYTVESLNQALRLIEQINMASSFEELSSIIFQYEDATSEYDNRPYPYIASLLLKRFHFTSDARYLDFAIELLYTAHATAVVQEKVINRSDLAILLLERYTKVSNSTSDLDGAMQAFRTDMLCCLDPDRKERFQAACSYANLCLTYKDAVASMRPFKIVNNLIHDIVDPSLPLDYTSIPTMRVALSNSVSAAMEAQYFDYGLEWFEHGRCVVWNYILRVRMPADKVHSIAPDMANKKDVIAAQLATMGDTILDRNYRNPAFVKSVTGYGMLVQDLDRLILDVRELPGLENFLSPKNLVELMSATILGPIVIINIAERRSDALILQEGRDSILHVPLPDAKYQSLANGSSAVTNLLRGSEVEVRLKGGREGEKAVMSMEETLNLLWTSVVEPVFRRLGWMSSPPRTKLPRITWCVSGSLAFLPLHAAGIYKSTDLPSRAAFEYAVHSYTPSLSALAEALHQHKRMQKVEVPNILAVSQPATPNQSPLPGTVAEVYAIKSVVGENLKWLNDSEATCASVLPLISQYPWIHFACHAKQDPVEATQSAFMLHDGGLTLRQLMQHTNLSGRKALAVLSACQTATGAMDMPEEAIHLAAGMLMTGFQSVIATMWSIGDDDAPIVMKSFYSYLLHKAKGDSAQSSHALHYAVEQLRKKVGVKNFLRWVPFMHLGV